MKQVNLNLPDTILGLETGLLKVVLLPVPLIIGFIICLSLVIVPKINEINNINAKIAQVKDQTKLVTDKKNYLQSIDKDQLKTNAGYFDSALLKEKKTYVLVGIVRTIADKYGFQVKSFSISPGNLKTEDKVKIADKEVLTKIPISVNLIGPKDKHLDLLLALENSLPILVIDQFQINATPDTADLDLGISSYYVSEKVNQNITNLTINDLALKKDESDLINKISQFEKVESSGLMVATDSASQYTKFERPNPFSL